jgi:osmotically-inducible protein OsmY
MDDDTVRREVTDALDRWYGLDATAVTVEVRGGAVTLGGSVPDAAQRELAVRVASGVAGVLRVEDRDLEVVAVLEDAEEPEPDTEDLVPGRFGVH